MPVHRIKNGGFTLFELLICIAVVGIIMGAVYQIVGQTTLTITTTADRQDLVLQARYALERMTMFVQESDQIAEPASTEAGEVLKVSERISDQHTNATHAYNAAGDQLLDADNDANGLVNNVAADPPDYITFDIDKTDPANWKLMEQMPEYATSATGDYKPKRIICEHVHVEGPWPGSTGFSCRRPLGPSGVVSGRVEIALTLKRGNETVTLKTTAKARWMD